jgi:flagellar motor switch protein FliG
MPVSLLHNLRLYPGLILLLLTAWLAYVPAANALPQEGAANTTAQNEGDNNTDNNTEVEEEEAANANVSRSSGAIPSRPLSAYERFTYESGIANQLQGLVGRYINASLFHVSVQVDGRMITSVSGSTPGALPAGKKGGAAVKGKPADNVFQEEDKTLEMLPALPFFSSRLRAPVSVEGEDTGDNAETVKTVNTPKYEPGPVIDRIKVMFVVDSTIDAESTNFYKDLIQNSLRLDTRRGDEIVVSTTSFPKSEATANIPSVMVNANLKSDPMKDETLIQTLTDIGNNVALLIGAGLGIVGILLFIGLIWRTKRHHGEDIKAEITGAGSNAGAAWGGGMDQMMYNGAPGGAAAASGPITINQTAYQDSQSEELRNSDPILNWLINERENLAFCFERWIRDQGSKGIQKLVMLLYPYGRHYFEMLSEQLEPSTFTQISQVWNNWNPDAFDSSTRARTQEELVNTMRSQKQFGNFPFIIYLKDQEIVDLLADESPLHCLMVLEGLAPARKSALMEMLGTDRTTAILSAYADLTNLRFGAYDALSSELFVKLKGMRENSVSNDKAFAAVLNTIQQQSINKQEEMVSQLQQSNLEMYEYIRERLVMWSDIATTAEETLRDLTQGMDSDSFAALIGGDQNLGDQLLALRPAREQLLLKDLIANNRFPAERTEQERRKLLQQLNRLHAANATIKTA